MIVVIQCAASKRRDAGRLRTREGRPVLFVANPDKAPPDRDHNYARPDDPSDTGVSWRQSLLGYNQEPRDNPLALARAYQLYEHPVYGRLVKRFGVEKVYILSAGWGLIRADFLTPDYDITFSASAEIYKRRRRSESYADLCMVPPASTEPILFFGGKDYVPLFRNLTAGINAERTIFYNSVKLPDAPSCNLVRYNTATRTNWHYECVGALLDGRIPSWE